MARNPRWDTEKLSSHALRAGAREPGASAATRRVEGARAAAAADGDGPDLNIRERPEIRVQIRWTRFAEHPTINVVNTIMRVKRDGLDSVLIVGSGNASMSCFVPDGGTASCAALKLTSVDAAQLVGSHDGDATSLLDMDVGVDHRLGLVDPAQRRPDQLRLRLVGWAASRIASVSTRVSSAGSSAAISRTAATGSTRQGTNELVHSDDVALLENLPPSCSRPWWSTRRVEPPRRIEQRSFARS